MTALLEKLLKRFLSFDVVLVCSFRDILFPRTTCFHEVMFPKILFRFNNDEAISVMAIIFFTGFRTMTQVFSRPANKRQVKETHFETDPETAVRLKIQEQNQDKKFVFYYDETAVIVPFNSSMWVLGTTAKSKLALKPGDEMRIIHKSKDLEASFLESGKSKEAQSPKRDSRPSI